MTSGEAGQCSHQQQRRRWLEQQQGQQLSNRSPGSSLSQAAPQVQHRRMGLMQQLQGQVAVPQQELGVCQMQGLLLLLLLVRQGPQHHQRQQQPMAAQAQQLPRSPVPQGPLPLLLGQGLQMLMSSRSSQELQLLQVCSSSLCHTAATCPRQALHLHTR